MINFMPNEETPGPRRFNTESTKAWPSIIGADGIQLVQFRTSLEESWQFNELILPVRVVTECGIIAVSWG